MKPIAILSLALLAMPLGALLGYFLCRNPERVPLLEGLTAGTLGVIVVLHLVPHSIASLGWTAPLPIIAGFLLIVLAERGAHHHGSSPRAAGEVVWLCLLLHNFQDGVILALGSSNGADDGMLLIAVVAHRLPMAAVLFWMDFAAQRPRIAVVRLVVMSLTMMVGVLFADRFVAMMEPGPLAWLYALSTGAFIHMAGHDFLARLVLPRARIGILLGGAPLILTHFLGH